MPETDGAPLALRVSEALGKDVGRGYARLDPADLAKLGAEIGDILEIAGKRKTVCRAMPAYKETRGPSRIQIDGLSVEELAAATDMFSGADIQAVCQRAALDAIRKAIERADKKAPDKQGKVRITRAHLERALESVRAQQAAG